MVCRLLLAAIFLMPSALMAQFGGGPFGGSTGPGHHPTPRTSPPTQTRSRVGVNPTTPPIAGRTRSTDLKNPSPVPNGRPNVIAIDSPPIRTSPRSTPRNRQGRSGQQRCPSPQR